jgi:exo-beta-1,3-glucanase (GH17 family)
VGVNYGRVATNLPKDQAKVAKLLTDNGITKVRIYDTEPTVLASLANTGIKVMVMLPNENIAAAATDQSYARQWVQSNVAAYLPATQIDGVSVGNEVFDSNPELNSQLVLAMSNVHDGLVAAGLANSVKVTTPVAFDALTDTFPPSDGRFKDEFVPVMKPMLDFLQRTGSYLSMNIYPYFTYVHDPQEISLDYALGNAKVGVYDDKAKLTYYSLLDAQTDATYHAMEALGFLGVSLYVSEHGWPSQGKPRHGQRPPARRLLDTGGDGSDAASIANAQTSNNNVINRVLSGHTGTPYRPNADMDVYIFALFNENGKGGDDDVESNFGLFYPDMTKVYDFSFQGTDPPAVPTPAPMSWCVANAAVGDARLQEALDWACANGADCSAIQPGASCFDPDTKVAHASYAFNSYYQNNNRATGACDFKGAASIVYQKPADTCGIEPMSWCVANSAVGDARLQTALDYACANGADCSAIQPGGSCFQPNNMVAHASYAFNSYYQNKGRASGTCDFSGAGTIMNQQPASEHLGQPVVII